MLGELCQEGWSSYWHVERDILANFYNIEILKALPFV